MNKVYKKLEDLNEKIWYIYNYHFNQIMYMKKLLEQGLETIFTIKSHPEVGKDELEIMIAFSESIIQMSKDASWQKYDEKNRQTIYQLQEKMEQEVASMKEMDQMNVTYTNLNEWIQSLHVCRYRKQARTDKIWGLGVSPYQTSYELYVDLRNAIMNKKMGIEEKIYIGKIIEKLDSERGKLSEEAKIEVADYELSCLIKMMRNHPDFNYKLMKTSLHVRIDDWNRFAERKMEFGKRKVLEHKLRMLTRNEEND